MDYGYYDYDTVAFGVAAVVWLVIMLFGLATYILSGIAMLRMAKKTGVNNGWLAFIPVGNCYILGRIADAGRGKRTVTRALMGGMIALAVLMVVYFVLLIGAVLSSPMADEVPLGFAIALILWALVVIVLSIVLSVFEYIAYYRMAKNFGGANGTAYFVGILLGGFFVPVVVVILLLILSGKTPALTDFPQVQPAVEPPVQTDSVF